MLPEPYFPKWLKKLIKAIFFAALIVGVLLIILGNIGGRDSMFKVSIEDFMRETTGYHAEIVSANNIRFFPNIIIDFSNLSLFETDQKLKNKAFVGRWHSVMSFWDVLAGNGRFKYLLLENVAINDESLSSKGIAIKTVNIQKDETRGPQEGFTLEGFGQIGEYPFNFSLPLDTEGSDYSQTFTFGSNDPIFLSLGTLKIDGKLHIETSGLKIEGFNATLEGKSLFNNKNIIIDTNRNVYMHLSERAKTIEMLKYIEASSGTRFIPQGLEENGNDSFSLWGLTFLFEQNSPAP